MSMGCKAQAIFGSISMTFNPHISGLFDLLLRMLQTLKTFLSPAITAQFFGSLDATRFVCFFVNNTGNACRFILSGAITVNLITVKPRKTDQTRLRCSHIVYRIITGNFFKICFLHKMRSFAVSKMTETKIFLLFLFNDRCSKPCLKFSDGIIAIVVASLLQCLDVLIYFSASLIVST